MIRERRPHDKGIFPIFIFICGGASFPALAGLNPYIPCEHACARRSNYRQCVEDCVNRMINPHVTSAPYSDCPEGSVSDCEGKNVGAICEWEKEVGRCELTPATAGGFCLCNTRER